MNDRNCYSETNLSCNLDDQVLRIVSGSETFGEIKIKWCDERCWPVDTTQLWWGGQQLRDSLTWDDFFDPEARDPRHIHATKVIILPEAQVNAMVDAKVMAEAKAKANTQAKLKAKADPKAKAKVKANTKAKAKAKAKANPTAKAKAKAKANTKANTKAKAKAKQY